ncbi:MAG: ATP-binding protein [Candidatus Dormibacterales bacterium]
MTLPTGTVTFLFTDIEGSTRLMQELGDRYPPLQEAHHDILREAFRSNEGRELRTEGDSFFCVFASALDACSAAAAAQRAFERHPWPEGTALRVRVGLHTGEAPLVGNEYIGLDVHHAARIAGAAHGGQVLVSEATDALVAGSLPAELTLRDLGSHRLKDMARAEHLFQLVIAGVTDTFPALRTLDGTPNNLPTQLTSFIGRSAIVAEAKRLLEGSRLLTLTGEGGIGKTRLSLQVAAETFEQFPDGVYFVPLSAVRDPELVPSVIARVLGVQVVGNRLPIDALIDHLRGRKLLLVMDNFEQLLPAAAGLPNQLLQASPDLKVIVSSRAPLRAYGEQEFAVQPLLLPDMRLKPSLEALSQFEAVRLFIDRAVTVKSDFQATNENAPAIAGICERVDGLPLAIELAAARVKLFSPQALLSRLDKSLSALGSGARDLPGRQRTLEGAIAWSYDMLDSPGRRLMARFAVFARGAALDQAEAVCGPPEELGVDVLTGLDELADQSLLRRQPDFEEPRLLMLQTIRDFAATRLEESKEGDLMRDRHAAAYMALAQEAEPHFFGDQGRAWLDRVERDHDNFRAALDWSVSKGNAERAMWIGAALWRFWQMRGHLHEARARLEAVLELPAADAYPGARRRALEAAGGIAYWQGDMPAAEAWYGTGLELTRADGSRRELAEAIYNASFPLVVNTEHGINLPNRNLVQARALLEEALPIYQELGDEAGVAKTYWAIGNSFHFEQLYDQAIPPLNQAIVLFRKVQDRFLLAWSLHTRSLVAIRTSDPATAKPMVREALNLFSNAGDVSGIAILLDDYAQLALLDGDTNRAARIKGAAAALRAKSGSGLGSIIDKAEGRTVEGAPAGGEAKAWAEGLAMTIEEAVAYAHAGDPRN